MDIPGERLLGYAGSSTFALARGLFPDLVSVEDGALAAQPKVMPLWWALTLSSCLGEWHPGGASANVVAVGITERRGESIGF